MPLYRDAGSDRITATCSDSSADAAAQHDRGLADDAEDGLEALPPACALKSGWDAGDGTRWLSLPRRLQWCQLQLKSQRKPEEIWIVINA